MCCNTALYTYPHVATLYAEVFLCSTYFFKMWCNIKVMCGSKYVLANYLLKIKQDFQNGISVTMIVVTIRVE